MASKNVQKNVTVPSVPIYTYEIQGTTLLRQIKDDKEIIDFPLRKVEKKEILQLRYSGRPGFILKLGDDLYYGDITADVRIYNNLENFEKHMCATCNRCRAASDNMGGCQKVRDILPDDSAMSKKKKIAEDKRIEKYDFVKIGYETFNCKAEVLGIVKCTHYKKIRPRQAMDFQTLNELRGSLEELYVEIFRDGS